MADIVERRRLRDAGVPARADADDRAYIVEMHDDIERMRGRIARGRNAPGLNQHGARGKGIGTRDHRPQVPTRRAPCAALEF